MLWLLEPIVLGMLKNYKNYKNYENYNKYTSKWINK